MALAAIALVLGCSKGGPEIVPVAGQIRIDGKPVPYGQVIFYPEGARRSAAKLDEDGRFQLSCKSPHDGAVVGKHKIAVSASQPITETISSATVKWHAPKKYADVATSDLTYDISGPSDDVVINLSWSGGKPFTETFAIEEEPEHTNWKPPAP